MRPREAKELARRAERIGCDAVWVLDVRREPYLTAAAALDATESIQVGTNVAVAFARSPTVTASAAWDLSLWSGGRFILGLGSQTGPTLFNRFGVHSDHPGPRMRDYVAATRSCFEAFARGYGRYQGPYYDIRRPAFQPGADEGVSAPPIYVAGVNPFMTQVAGDCADGFAAHMFTTELYIEEVLRPALAEGALRAHRPPPPVLLQVVAAETREQAARQMIAYTVPGYRRVLEHAGVAEAGDAVIQASSEGRRSEAARIVDERYLDLLAVCLVDELPQAVARWAPHCDRLGFNVPWFGIDSAAQLAATHRLLDALESLPD
ncbi:MAG TPA: LLM class flavin-dependent oxidoreductase [Candidatus Dormibacteraeota bacterium]